MLLNRVKHKLQKCLFFSFGDGVVLLAKNLLLELKELHVLSRHLLVTVFSPLELFVKS